MTWAIVLLGGGVLATLAGLFLARLDHRRSATWLERGRSWTVVIGGLAFVAVGAGAVWRAADDRPVWGLERPYTVDVESRCDHDVEVALAQDDPPASGERQTLAPRGRVELVSEGNTLDDDTDRDAVEISGLATVGDLDTFSVYHVWLSDLEFHRDGGRWRGGLVLEGDDCLRSPG